jgi:allophanate hydrolase subunit 1
MRMLIAAAFADVLSVMSALRTVLIGYDRNAVTQHHIGLTLAQTLTAIAAERKRRRVRVESRPQCTAMRKFVSPGVVNEAPI